MKNKRKKLLIYPEIQLPLLYMAINLVLVVTLIQTMTLIVFIYIYRYGDVGLQLSLLKDVVFNIFYYRAHLLLILLIPLVFIVLLFSRYFLFISNKYAGPIYKIERTLDQIIETGEYKEIKIRAADLLFRFVEKLNNSLDILKNKKS